MSRASTVLDKGPTALEVLEARVVLLERHLKRSPMGHVGMDWTTIECQLRVAEETLQDISLGRGRHALASRKALRQIKNLQQGSD